MKKVSGYVGLLVWIEYTNVTDRHTDIAPCIASRGKMNNSREKTVGHLGLNYHTVTLLKQLYRV